MGWERVMVLGNGGTGKSTVARELGDRLGLPVVHLDQLFWNPGWVAAEPGSSGVASSRWPPHRRG